MLGPIEIAAKLSETNIKELRKNKYLQTKANECFYSYFCTTCQDQEGGKKMKPDQRFQEL